MELTTTASTPTLYPWSVLKSNDYGLRLFLHQVQAPISTW